MRIAIINMKTHARESLIALGLLALFPQLAFPQALIVSEREEIVNYSAEELNPAKPGYEWEGATLLQDIRVIDGDGLTVMPGLIR